jgi:hypothetical protein
VKKKDMIRGLLMELKKFEPVLMPSAASTNREHENEMLYTSPASHIR